MNVKVYYMFVNFILSLILPIVVCRRDNPVLLVQMYFIIIAPKYH